MLSSILSAVLLASSALATPLSTSPVSARKQTTLPLAPVHDAVPSPISNSYIVVFKPDTPLNLITAHTTFISTVHSEASNEHDGLNHVYMGLKGYSGSFDEATLALIRSQPEVDYVEHDQMVWASGIESQNGAPWGLARISHRKRLTLGTFRKYVYNPDGGEGVDAYVIDTGINVNHVEFEGRARWGATIPKNDVDEDGNGHGTHCAGTIASRAYGVAKAAHVIAIKVLGSNGSGSMSDVIAGVDWAATSAAAKAAAVRAEEIKTGKKSTFKGSVANLSLGGGKSPSLDRAINAAVDSGLHIAVAAGNDNKDACNYSPAAAEKAVTVGATTLQDSRAYFSNFGKCVDVFAPGLNILSTWNGNEHATNTISGTSMASPHVAGLLAYLLSIYPSSKFSPELEPSFLPSTISSFISSNPTLNTLASFAASFLPSYFASSVAAIEAQAPIPSTITPAQLKKALIALASKDILTDVGSGSPNVLVYNNATTSLTGSWWNV